MTHISAPQSIDELLTRANQLAGRTLASISSEFHAKLPDSLLLEKGWVGQFLEFVLGATAGSKPEPDFPQLAVELKTIPINEKGKPLESTFVSVVPMRSSINDTWERSVVRDKLKQVLWIPVLSTKQLPIRQRIIGSPILWQPNESQWNILQTDWEEAMEKVALGDFGQLNSRFGEALQVRPKAANSKVVVDTFDDEGVPGQTLPRGFYLRTRFTQQILAAAAY